MMSEPRVKLAVARCYLRAVLRGFAGPAEGAGRDSVPLFLARLEDLHELGDRVVILRSTGRSLHFNELGQPKA